MAKVCDECGCKHYARGKCARHYKMPSQLNPRAMAKLVKPIAKASSRQVKLNRAYKVIRDHYMRNHPVCEARLHGCTYHSTDLHHRHGRGQFLLNEATYTALCRSCHQWAEMNPVQAKQLGISGDRL
jgi:hypothetical protein